MVYFNSGELVKLGFVLQKSIQIALINAGFVVLAVSFVELWLVSQPVLQRELHWGQARGSPFVHERSSF